MRRYIAISRALAMLMLIGAAASVAQSFERTLTITDYTGRGFAPDLVRYTLAPPINHAARLRVTAADGRNVPLQVSAAAKGGSRTLSFVAEVAPNATATYRVRDDGAGAVPTGVRVQAGKAGLELSNGLLAVRIPPEQQKIYRTPVKAGTLPAPILAFRSGASDWLGDGVIRTERQVKAWSVKVLERGPAFVDVRYAIDWAEGGYYHADIRVVDRVPIVTVREEYDLGKLDGGDCWELNLTQGWNPDTAETAKTWGNGGVAGSSDVPLPEVKLDPIQPSGAYGNMLSELGLYNAAQAKADPDGYTLAGVVPLHQGQWRRIFPLPLQSPDGNKTILLRLPMTRETTWWAETSPFSTITHEDALPDTYARRAWALVLGKPPLEVKAGFNNMTVGPCYQARLLYGAVGLDRYKDYITDWQQENVAYPRSLIKQDEVPKYRTAWQANPDDALLKNLYAAGGSEAAAKTSLTRALNNMNRYIAHLISCPTPSHHALYDGASIVAHAEQALAWPGLPPEQRADLRIRLAVLAYLMLEGDTMGHANGAHTGNPNMSLARQCWVPALVALLPDHPMYERWKRFTAEYDMYKFATNMAPGGGWFEFGGYHMWGYARLMHGMFGLEAMGAGDLDRFFMYHKSDLDYFMNLLTPFDARYGARIVPGLGNSQNRYMNHLIEAAGSFAERDPAFAAHLAWAWQADGAPGGANPEMIKPWIQPKEPKLTSRYFPGFGVIFRAHQGSAETYLALRSGFLWSHWYVDQGQMVLYSKGAPLFPSQPYAYYWSDIKDFSPYNDLRFGHPENEFPFGWPDSNVLACAFGDRVQYAWMSAGYPAWYIKPGLEAHFGGERKLAEGVEQRQGDFTWDRQMAFLPGKTAHSPNYFVIHDTVRGEGRLAPWLNFDLLGRKEDVQTQGDTLSLKTEWPTNLALIFPGGKAVMPEMAEDAQPVDLAGGLAGPWINAMKGRPVSRHWGRKDGKPIDPAKNLLPNFENHVLLRIPGTPGQDYFWLAYPRGAGEALPTVERLAPNVVKITHAEGTDYVLLAPVPDRYEGDGVLLEGAAAAVRVAQDGVTLSMLRDAGRVGYQGAVLQGIGPFERTIAPNTLRAETQTIAGQPAALTYQPQLVDHQPVADGVRKAVAGETTEYLIEGDAPVDVTDGNVHLEGRQAAVLLTPGTVRFVAPKATYVKLTAGTVGVRGMGPFDLTFTGDRMTGTVDGAARTLVITRPDAIVRPMFHLDAVRWYAGFADETSPFRGRDDAQFSVAFGVLDGKHTVDVREWTSPSLPPAPARRVLSLR